MAGAVQFHYRRYLLLAARCTRSSLGVGQRLSCRCTEQGEAAKAKVFDRSGIRASAVLSDGRGSLESIIECGVASCDLIAYCLRPGCLRLAPSGWAPPSAVGVCVCE